jgi:hypothetical protein
MIGSAGCAAGIITSECCEGVCGSECFESICAIDAIPAKPGVDEDLIAGCESRRCCAEAPPLEYRVLAFRLRRKKNSAIAPKIKGIPTPKPTPKPVFAAVDMPPLDCSSTSTPEPACSAGPPAVSVA